MNGAYRGALSRLLSKPFFLPLLSGLLLGISFPTWPAVHLEPLAWIALVPLLLSLEHEERFGPFFRKSWMSMLLFCLIALWWVCLATFVGGILTVFVQSLFSVVPLVVFYYFKKRAGFRSALLALPFIWTGWEWAYMQQDFSLGWLTFGNSQANLLWMVQYADVTGVWGVSFWLLTFNVLVLLLFMEKESFQVKVGIVMVMLVMIATPLLYARQVFRNTALDNTSPKVRVALVQPDIDPHEKWDGLGPEETLSRLYSLTGQSVRGERLELIIWPETAIPFYIRLPENKPYMDSVRRMVMRWNTPLLTGFPDEVPVFPNSARGEAVAASGAEYAAYNASMLLHPAGGPVQIYRKMRLVPFGERVPYSEYFPWLERLSFSMSGISSWAKGREATVMHFTSRDGQPVRMANIICYESIFPGQVSTFVRRGAQFLTLVTNDGWYGTSYGPWQHAAIDRLRCIENRRAMARCANTGVTLFYDICGRSYAETPWWQQSVLTADVPLESRITFYTAHPDLVPHVCLGIAGVLALVAAVRKR
ncbi:MAG TPA: apolipoprotein N-acyltransferase [Chlorobaculum sp.]|uniref:Apolipoprotein N-acyltransferase n=1 Tax=Chlorobaculum tepidum (strain ATCC 49652 / DSM 12025 / NBRC 103806 / TLS) TaxID=194439 RepID=LNT_CHLTE|nr:RecName: Full=Apolipoprotein N-acyltransferase; Short=ALP N-acyltransferase [Chlorobaculum tepidum TLS]AAM72725.1 apolipoprotein N-acyltransferase [Chlorobaculum tepidum TLS]HBU22612.1 apolipoprotein N-acyltransferase [Chlorobaculum sp.]